MVYNFARVEYFDDKTVAVLLQPYISEISPKKSPGLSMLPSILFFLKSWIFILHSPLAIIKSSLVPSSYFITESSGSINFV